MNLHVFQQKPNVLSPLQIIGLLAITATPNFSSFLKPAHYMYKVLPKRYDFKLDTSN